MVLFNVIDVLEKDSPKLSTTCFFFFFFFRVNSVIKIRRSILMYIIVRMTFPLAFPTFNHLFL